MRIHEKIITVLILALLGCGIAYNFIGPMTEDKMIGAALCITAFVYVCLGTGFVLWYNNQMDGLASDIEDIMLSNEQLALKYSQPPGNLPSR